MDNQAYLDQITASTRPSQSKQSPFSSLIFKIAALGIGLTVIIIIFGSLLGAANNKERDLSEQLSIRMTNLSETINTYNSSVKSPELRSIGTSFSTVLANTNRDLSNYLVAKYNFDPKKANQKMLQSETQLIEDLNTALEDARLNGILDRTYVNKLNLEITLLLSLESDILSRTTNSDLQNILQNSTSSLESLLNSTEKYNNNS